MALETLELDAAGSTVDGTNPGSALVVSSATANYGVIEFSSPAPSPKLQWASSIDTEGARRADPSTYENRTVSLTIDVYDTGATTTHLDALAGKVGKLHREGGTLKWVRKDGSVRIFDLLASDGFTATIDVRHVNGITQVTVSFLALPGLRGTEVDLGDNTTTTLPYLSFEEASIAGQLDGLGRLVIDEDDADDQGWLVWGIEQNRHYAFTDSTGSGALFYEAESRTAMGGSATAVGPTGASGAGSNVMRNTALTQTYQAILSTQATGGGAHLSHVGTFRVFARVYAVRNGLDEGTVEVALEWGEGDYRRFTRNTVSQIPGLSFNSWQIIDLGLVNVTKVVAGTQRWEGRLLAKYTLTSGSGPADIDLDVDWLMLVPTTEGYGTVSRNWLVPAPTVFNARDEFDQSAGALTTKTLPVGGTWTGAGDADDWQVDATDRRAERAVAADTADIGRYAIAGSTNYTATAVQADVLSTTTANTAKLGVFARYTDTSNFVLATLEMTSSLNGYIVRVRKRVAGTFTTLGGVEVGGTAAPFSIVHTLRLVVSASGVWAVWLEATGTTLRAPLFSGDDSALAAAGALATGKPGFYGETSGGTPTLAVDNFQVWAPQTDAAVFASQSAELRHDRFAREDSGGTLWLDKTIIGHYLTVPPAGAEARTTRVLVKGSRHVPGEGPDTGIDDISARLFVTPRYLT